jgi:lysophospholipase L1-like esterase
MAAMTREYAMNRIWIRGLLTNLLVLALAASVSGQQTSWRWRDAAELAIEGRGWDQTRHMYDRLPAKAESLVRPPVWELAQHSAGLSVRFVTNAPTISVRWKLRFSRLEMPHMPATGVSGVDLYVRDDQSWHFLGNGRPLRFPDNESILVRDLEPMEREFRLYFPLYNGVERLEIGVPDGAVFRSAIAPAANRRPIVFYGTSITQGGCAARPGMAYPAILGRMLDMPVINLGFSGNGKTEPELARLLAEIEASAFVLDSLPNLETAQVGERLPKFIEILRERHANVPILLVESIPYPDKRFVAKRDQRFTESNAILHRIFSERRERGDTALHYLTSEDFLGPDGEATVDGVHPTDLGFQRMANSLATPLRSLAGRSPGD